MKNKKIKIILIVLGIIAIIGGALSFFIIRNEIEKDKIALQKEKREIEKRELIDEINSHYNELVITNKNSKLYRLENNKYNEIGNVSKGEIFKLGEVSINEDTKYFYLSELDLYISYLDVDVYKEVVEKDLRYKNYILFNENVISKDKVSLYRNDNVIYTLNYSIDEEIIIKDDNGYYVEYFGELFLVKNEDVLKTYEKNNSNEVVANEVPVTVYHFIYLNGDNTCNEIICHSENQIKEQFQYLKDNQYFTMNTTEMMLFLEKKIRVPKNSILITIDDGARAEKFIPFLEEYKINATLFLITSWYSKDIFNSPYMEIASHTHNMHNPGVCSGGQGSPLKCLDNNELVSDLKTSRELLNGTEAFCYPFYEFNNHAIKAVSDAGFKICFIGGQKKANIGVNIYAVPRITIHNSTSINQYINYVK